jgi:gas vesicle protein
VKIDLVDIGMINDLIANSIIDTWEKISPIFKKAIEQNQNPSIFDDFKYLYNEIKNTEKNTQKQHNTEYFIHISP